MNREPSLQHRELSPEHPLLRGRTGRGVSVAVIDSGVHPGHPHVGGLVGGVGIADDGSEHADLLDRLGHGTAVTAAIHEKAPAAEIHVVKVFHDTLSTNVESLVQALDWAAEAGVRLVNLSLGTANPDNVPPLASAIERLRRRGSILVSAGSQGERTWYPGSLPGVVSVVLDATCPREGFRRVPSEEGLRLAASGFARPIPGVPPERNLNGVSFSVANATGLLACLLEGREGVGTVAELTELLRG